MGLGSAEAATRVHRMRSLRLRRSAGTRLALDLVCDRNDADPAAAAAMIGELHMTRDLREQGVVLATADVQARAKALPALPHENRSAGHEVAVVPLDAEA